MSTKKEDNFRRLAENRTNKTLNMLTPLNCRARIETNLLKRDKNVTISRKEGQQL